MIGEPSWAPRKHFFRDWRCRTCFFDFSIECLIYFCICSHNFVPEICSPRHKYTAKARATNDAKSKNRSRDLKTMQAKTKNIITDFADLPSEDEKKRKANAGKPSKGKNDRSCSCHLICFNQLQLRGGHWLRQSESAAQL